MLFLKKNPLGIDSKINMIQKSIFNKIDLNDVNVYGRIYRNPSDNGFKPEVYINDLEYKDVLTDDTKNGSVFFIEDETYELINGYYFEVEVKIVFMLDLAKLSGSQNRNDIEVQNKVLLEIRKHKFFTITKIEKGIDNIFKGFDTSNIKINDMQPYHVFAIVGKLKYSINQC